MRLKEETNRVTIQSKPERFSARAAKDFRRNSTIYLMPPLVVAFYAVFHYGPLYGLQIAFKNFSAGLGIWNSPWVGFQHFSEFFNGFFFERVVTNTIILGAYDLIFVFPHPSCWR